MTLQELMDQVRRVCPMALFDEDGSGEVVVYTGLRTHPDEDWLVGGLPVLPVDTNV